MLESDSSSSSSESEEEIRASKKFEFGQSKAIKIEDQGAAASEPSLSPLGSVSMTRSKAVDALIKLEEEEMREEVNIFGEMHGLFSHQFDASMGDLFMPSLRSDQVPIPPASNE